MLIKEKQQDPIIVALKKFFELKAGFFRMEMAFLYGSRAEGFPRPDSDVDIAIVFEDEVKTEEGIFNAMVDIALALEKEIGKEINVIPIYRDFRKPLLYYNAIVMGVPVYFKDYDGYVALRNEAINQMEDFELFGKKWQIMVARNNLEALDRG